MKIGRNAPCRSGKKYKKCCLNQKAAPSQALYYQRLLEAYVRLAERLAGHASQTFGENVVNMAMHEFLLWPEATDEIDDEQLERLTPLFYPWFLFNWEYNAIDAEVELRGPEDRTVAELYAEAHAGQLDPLERRLIESINRKPYSFWEVLQVDEGLGMRLENMLIGGRIAVHEDTGSEFVKAGDLLFGRAVSVDGVGMTIGRCAVTLPPYFKPEVIQLCKGLRRGRSAVTNDTLYEWDAEIQDIDAMMGINEGEMADLEASSEHEELVQLPEVQEQLDAMLTKHWEGWVDLQLPALGGQSPREAVKTADGCVAVEALLQDAENSKGQDPVTTAINRQAVQRARALLGLNPR